MLLAAFQHIQWIESIDSGRIQTRDGVSIQQQDEIRRTGERIMLVIVVRTSTERVIVVDLYTRSLGARLSIEHARGHRHSLETRRAAFLAMRFGQELVQVAHYMYK